MQKLDTHITLNNFNNICRVCLNCPENGELQSIYGILVESQNKTEPVDIVMIFKRYCDVEVNTSDEKPQNICKSCITSLCESFTFFDKCFQTNKILDKIIGETKIKSLKEELKDQESKDKSNKSASSNQPDLYFSEEEYKDEDDSDWEPSTANYLNKDVKVKVEKEETNDEEDGEDENRRRTEDALEIKIEKRVTRNRNQQVTKRRGRPRKIATCKASMKNDKADFEAIENQHKELICRLCNLSLSNINDSIDHYDDVHAPKLEVDECIFCEPPKIYKKRDNLLYHMGLHSKDSIKCIPCRRYFRSKELLGEHLNECFKVDKLAVIKIEEALKANESNNATGQQLNQKKLKLYQQDGAFTCQLCNRHLGEIDAVIEHFEHDHLDDLLCIICLTTFSKRVPLFHLGLHSKKANICRPCRLFFKSKEEYDEHYDKYDHDKSLSCKVCGKKFSRNYKKNKHMLSHLKEKNFSCPKCGKTFTYKTSLVRHFKMHFGKRFLCSSCGNAYTTKFMLQRHIRIMHTNVDEDGKPLPKPPPKPVKLQCEFCGEIFTTKYGYGRHIRRHPEFKEFKCKICTFTCDTRDQLEAHMENKHNKHTCDVCGKRFPFESELKTHHRKHEDMETAKFRCDVCNKAARTQTQLKVHYRIHTGERPFSCEICFKSFKQTAHLKVHMFQHTGKMPFKCDICAKTFPFQHVMEIHMRIHTGEKPFRCTFCGNAYHDRTTLLKHHKKKHPDIPVQKVNRNDYSIDNLTVADQ